MKHDLSLAEAKAKFSECVRKAEAGSVVLLRRHGKAVAAIVPASDAEQLRRLRAAGPEGGLASVLGGRKGSDELVEAILSVPRSGPREQVPRRPGPAPGSPPPKPPAQNHAGRRSQGFRFSTKPTGGLWSLPVSYEVAPFSAVTSQRREAPQAGSRLPSAVNSPRGTQSASVFVSSVRSNFSRRSLNGSANH